MARPARSAANDRPSTIKYELNTEIFRPNTLFVDHLVMMELAITDKTKSKVTNPISIIFRNVLAF